jgi:hypothetical protein
MQTKATQTKKINKPQKVGRPPLNREPLLKVFSVRLPRETWLFLKQIAATQEITMGDIIILCIERYREELKNMLTHKNTAV